MLVQWPHLNSRRLRVAAVQWQWERDDSGWQTYDDAVSAQMEAARAAGEQHVYFDNERFADLQEMRQRRWDDPGRSRRIRRVAGGAA